MKMKKIWNFRCLRTNTMRSSILMYNAQGMNIFLAPQNDTKLENK